MDEDKAAAESAVIDTNVSIIDTSKSPPKATRALVTVIQGGTYLTPRHGNGHVELIRT